MPESMHIQLERWVQIAILQRYINVDQLKFSVETTEGEMPDQARLQAQLDELIKKTCRRFQLVPPGTDESSQGKHFDTWEQEMLVLFCCVNYDKIMCSVCPLSLGMEEMIQRLGAAPCSLLPKTKIYIFEPVGCAILATNYWDENSLIQNIVVQKDYEVAANFIGISRIFHPRSFPQ